MMWKRRKPIRPISKRRAKQNRERAQIAMLHYCEARQAGAPGACSGGLSKHEPLTRARGGSITDPENCRTVCIGHNWAISNDVETMRWAKANGFLKASWER